MLITYRPDKRQSFSSFHSYLAGFIPVGFLLLEFAAAVYGGDMVNNFREKFRNPSMDCRPHTRWWWMGDAVTKEEITWELQEMRRKGIGGVEQITMDPVYEKGNIPYLSKEYFDMIRHTVRTAKRLGMQVSLNFGGPGWVIGCPRVPQKDRSKNLVPTFIDLEGPSLFSGELPTELKKDLNYWEIPTPGISDADPLVAVVAGQVKEGVLDQGSLVILTSKVTGHTLNWNVPEGRWRLMAFWLKYTGQGCALDHFSEAAMRRYCEDLGGMYYRAIGEEFGKTVDSFFCDSFEVAFAPGGIYWSNGLLEEFQKRKGYDLTGYLPAIWWNIGALTPKIRYDVNEFLHQVGLDAFFKPFLEWCKAHNIQGRIQPYGFTTDILQGAGMTDIPEMEITAGEKDAVPWFDTRIGPKKYVSSGAHLYGRPIVTTEAYTFLHWQPYRATLEELKIASDIFLRSGANKFYNQGYCFSPERDVAPSRWFNAAIHISHDNVWWDYYPSLSKYIARCCYLLQQGHTVADIALYSPLANQWTLDVLNARKWTRGFDWGDLGKLLVANGYDFDLVNDDILQNHAKIFDGKILIRELEYKILILPNISSLPIKTLRFVQEYVREGGVVIALEKLAENSVGLIGHKEKDAQVKNIVRDMFTEPHSRNGTGRKKYGAGKTYFIRDVMYRKNVLDRRSSALDPFLNTLRDSILPDFAIDFAGEGLRENPGLTFVHRQLRDGEIYFVTNVQDQASSIPVTFRVKDRVPWKWNPYNGEISRIYHYREVEQGAEIPVHLAPYESTFIIFERGADRNVVQWTNLDAILSVKDKEIEAVARKNGIYRLIVKRAGEEAVVDTKVSGIPAPFVVAGDWELVLDGKDFPRLEKKLTRLESWTEDSRTESFSGTGRYAILFDLPSEYVTESLDLELDLGRVGNIAEVEINGAPVGTRWMRGQRLNSTKALRAGANRMVVYVTNTLINRVSHFKEPPPVPKELVPHYGKGVTPLSASQRGPIGFKPLPASGLIGPVRIYGVKRVTVSLP